MVTSHRSWLITYSVIWLTITVLALTIRFAVLRATSEDRRFTLALGYMFAVALLLASAGLYERRKIIRALGLAGRGTFGYFRGWIKTNAMEFAVDDHAEATVLKVTRGFRILRRLEIATFLVLFVVVPLLLL